MRLRLSQLSKRSFNCLAATGLSLLCHFNAVAQERLDIRIAPESVVAESTITLGNIASVSGADEPIARIRRISLGYSPDVGATRLIRRQQILLALQAAGFSPDTIRLDATENAIVRRSGQTVSDTELRKTIETSLLKNFHDTGIDARLVRLEIPAVPQVPTGEIEMQVDPSGVRNLFAPFSVPIEIRVDGRPITRVQVRAEIEAFADVLVASSDLFPNTQISGSNVRFEKIRLERPLSNYFRDSEKLRGTSVVREIRAGSEITTDAIVSIAVIKPGDLIQMETGSGQFRITVAGEAQAAGKIGEKIAVKNTRTGAVVQAIVVDKGLVRVSF